MKPVYFLVAMGISLFELEEHYSYSDLVGVSKAMSEKQKATAGGRI